MSGNTSKFAEVAAVGSASVWLPIKGYNEASCAVVADPTSSPSNEVTVQLRKATNNAGANAANLGSAVTGDYGVIASALAEELGEHTDGTPFTHVSAMITDEASPNTYDAVMLFTKADYATPQTKAQYVTKDD